MGDRKKHYSDSVVATTHFLKKCAILEQTSIDDAETVCSGINKTRKQEVLERPFKRGALGFDDYSYAMHNEYVLVENKQ